MAGIYAGIRIAELLGEGARTVARLGARGELEDIPREVENALQWRGRLNNANTQAPAYLLGQIGKEFLKSKNKDNDVEEEDERVKKLRTRADRFNNQFNAKMNSQYPKYREVINVENKNRIDDVAGLKNAYNSNSGLFVDKNTMYISGTGGKSGFGSKVNDVFSDIRLIPTHNTRFSEKYADAVRELDKNPNITRLVSHSLGSSVAQEINNRNNQKYITSVYGSPFVSMGKENKNPRALRFRNRNDPISMFDRNAIQVDRNTINPYTAHNVENMKTQGNYSQGVDDSVQVAQKIQNK